MPPTKFESSFIPKNPTSAAAASSYGSNPLAYDKKSEHTILGFIATILFIISVAAAAGIFGYKFYLNYSIENMTTELEAGRAALEEETVAEILRLNNRFLAADKLINRHLVLSPLFRFLEGATVRTVRFTDLFFSSVEKGLKLNLKGEARSYAALALQAELLNKSDFFEGPVFSDLRLDESGNVNFSFAASVNPATLSYKKEVERLTPVALPPAATTTATTTPR